ncbi:MAG TPA: heavy metal translocating P-type ATPase, partial [Symbiobacteriaceae bacterium]|nr:heavy metal translocating P-type ATPase [Symbiobacteriaceae bacterium]
EAGARHKIALRPDREAAAPVPFWQANPYVLPTAVAAVFALSGQVAEHYDYRIISIVLYGLAIVTGGYSTAGRGLRNLLKLEFDMDVLMTIAVAGAAAIGEWSEGAVVAVLFGVSEMLETYTMDRARQSLRSLMEIAPRIARVLRWGKEEEIPVEEVRVGDTLVVRPGEKLAMDGTIIAGRSAINQAAITGESIPVDKAPGDEVFAGTLNGEGALEVRVTRLVEDSTISRVIQMVEEAQAQRPEFQTFIERFAKYYTPGIMALAGLIILVPPLLLGAQWGPWIYQGLSLLVVGCPCALVLSTPVTIVSAISNAARNGVLIKGGAHLERAGSLQTIAFDKTGTLTQGRPEVTDVAATGSLTAEELVAVAAAVEGRSEHPLARAIVRRAGAGPSPHATADTTAIIGRGAKATVDGRTVYVGSPALFRDDLGLDLGAAAALVESWQSGGKTVMLVGTEAEVYGAVAVADTPRDSSRDALAALKQAGVARTVMLTGDNQRTANAIGGRLGVDEVRADLLPQDKVAALRDLERQHGAIGMVGDGVNDAPALAAATVGIAMGGAGTDVALETADIALMADDLSKLPFTIRLSRTTLRVIKQNIGLALGLKLLAVLAVFPGWLTLWLAIVADMGATILVTMNGMRLLRVRPEQD